LTNLLLFVLFRIVCCVTFAGGTVFIGILLDVPTGTSAHTPQHFVIAILGPTAVTQHSLDVLVFVIFRAGETASSAEHEATINLNGGGTRHLLRGQEIYLTQALGNKAVCTRSAQADEHLKLPPIEIQWSWA